MKSTIKNGRKQTANMLRNLSRSSRTIASRARQRVRSEKLRWNLQFQRKAAYLQKV